MKRPKNFIDDFSQRESGFVRRLELTRTAILAFAENHAGGAVEFPGQAQLGQHAVDTVGFLVNVLEEQDPAARFDLVGCAHGGRDQREIAADQRSARLARPHRAHGVRGPQRVGIRRVGYTPERLRLKQRLAKAGLCVGSEARECDGTVKRHQVREFLDGEMQCRDVAVAQEDFWIGPDQGVVDAVEKLRRAIAAADREHALDFGIAKRSMQIVDALVDRAAQVPFPLTDVPAKLGHEAKIPHGPFGEGQAVRIGNIARRRDQAYSVTRPQRSGADQLAFHAGCAGCANGGQSGHEFSARSPLPHSKIVVYVCASECLPPSSPRSLPPQLWRNPVRMPGARKVSSTRITPPMRSCIRFPFGPCAWRMGSGRGGCASTSNAAFPPCSTSWSNMAWSTTSGGSRATSRRRAAGRSTPIPTFINGLKRLHLCWSRATGRNYAPPSTG